MVLVMVIPAVLLGVALPMVAVVLFGYVVIQSALSLLVLKRGLVLDAPTLLAYAQVTFIGVTIIFFVNCLMITAIGVYTSYFDPDIPSLTKYMELRDARRKEREGVPSSWREITSEWIMVVLTTSVGVAVEVYGNMDKFLFVPRSEVEVSYVDAAAAMVVGKVAILAVVFVVRRTKVPSQQGPVIPQVVQDLAPKTEKS